VAQPRSINLPGSRARTQQYELAPGLAQYVQAVYVEVDNTAGSSTRPLLTLSEQSGVVIAKKRQDAPIPAGTSDSATWALRLEADLSGVIRFDVDNIGGSLNVETTGAAGIIFYADAPGQIQLHSESLIVIESDGDMRIDADGQLLASFGQTIIDTDSTTLRSQASGTELDSRGPITLDTSAGSSRITLRVPNGASVEVQDSANNPIFRVNSDGSLQGKTGKALTFNL